MSAVVDRVAKLVLFQRTAQWIAAQENPPYSSEEKAEFHRNKTMRLCDVLVLATGFRADRFMRPMQLIGRGGKRLVAMRAKRPAAYLSISMPDFPNLFMLNGPNGPVGKFTSSGLVSSL